MQLAANDARGEPASVAQHRLAPNRSIAARLGIQIGSAPVSEDASERLATGVRFRPAVAPHPFRSRPATGSFRNGRSCQASWPECTGWLNFGRATFTAPASTWSHGCAVLLTMLDHILIQAVDWTAEPGWDRQSREEYVRYAWPSPKTL